MKILVADDIEDCRIFLEKGLESQGYTVVTVDNGKTALMKAKEWKPDIIISDIMMPEMDGFELCRKVKTDNELNRVCFVFYTATFVGSKDEQLAMALGASKFIVKPMDLEEFFKIIELLIKDLNQGKLAVPESTNADGAQLKQMYLDSIMKKLEKKVFELEEKKEALQLSELKYGRLVENLKEEYIFYSRDVNGMLTYVSPSVTNVLGYSQEEFLKHYRNYLTDNPINKKIANHSKLTANGKSQLSFPAEICHKEGSTVWLEIKDIPIFDKDGAVIAIEGIAHDFTEKVVAEKNIENALHEKELLLQEVYHRTRNNMQIICSLINRETGRLKSDEAQYALKKIENEIHFMALAHQKLYESQNLNEINMKDYVNDMIENLRKSYHERLDQINFEFALEDVFMSIDEAIPCSLIFHELISNSIYHAFPANTSGVIKLCLRNREEDKIEVCVKDNGVGFSEGFDFRDAQSNGLQTILSLAEYQLKGKASFLVDNGLDFQLTFKKNKRKGRV